MKYADMIIYSHIYLCVNILGYSFIYPPNFIFDWPPMLSNNAGKAGVSLIRWLYVKELEIE